MHVDALWEARNMEARSPEKLVDASSVKVSDEVRFLFLNAMIKANTMVVELRDGILRVASKLVLSQGRSHYMFDPCQVTHPSY